jgi:hypothetical protein
MARKQQSEFPFGLVDRTGYIPSACPIVAVGESFQAVRIIRKDLWPEVKICDATILRDHIAPNLETSVKERSIYYLDPENHIQRDLQHLRYMALEHGATPEAIRLLGSIEPWTKKEEKIMAEKLKAKASAAKPDKEGLKSAAKAAPVKKGGSAPAKKRGNAEALARARAAKGPDTRKITPKIKAKDIQARAGTFRHQMLNDLLNSKTVAEFKAKNAKYDAGCLRYAEEAGIVSVA